jgi:hypothetical protein
MDEIDVIKRLSADVPDPDLDARRRIAAPLLDLIGAAPARRLRASRPVTVLVVAAAIGIAGGAIAWALSNGSGRDTTSVQCLIGGNDTIIPATTGDPVQDCAAHWRRRTGSNPPELVAYDNGLGGITVMPADQAPLPRATALPAGEAQNVSLIALQQSLDDYISGLRSGCYDSATATAMTQQALARFGLTGWSITLETEAEGAAERCINIAAVDPAARTVELQGSPGGRPSSDAEYVQLAAKLRAVAERCMPLEVAAREVRSAADSLGLSEAGSGYELTEVPDNDAECTTIVENVGGTIFLIIRGPTD